jgi:hypothetical protein
MRKRKSRQKKKSVAGRIDPDTYTADGEYRYMVVGDRFTHYEDFVARAHQDAGGTGRTHFRRACLTLHPVFIAFFSMSRRTKPGTSIENVAKNHQLQVDLYKAGVRQFFFGQQKGPSAGFCISLGLYLLRLHLYIACSKDGVWVVRACPRCRCPLLLPHEKRKRAVKGTLKPKEVRNTVRSCLSGSGRASKVKEMSLTVYRETGEFLEYDQTR